MLGAQEDKGPSPDSCSQGVLSECFKDSGVSGLAITPVGSNTDKAAGCWQESMEVYHRLRKKIITAGQTV